VFETRISEGMWLMNKAGTAAVGHFKQVERAELALTMG